MDDLQRKAARYLRQQGDLFSEEYYFEENPIASDAGEHLSLDEWRERVENCTKCPLSQTRTKAVFGGGDPQADLLFIGEAPGEQEDLQGVPFVGRAGKLLDKILAAIELRREDVYIANILKCRPPKNRTPHADEIEQCEPYLQRQIELIQPKLIICLGLTAAKTLLRVEYTLRQMRGEVYNYHAVDLIVTYHPAALLRNPNLKKAAWEDFQKVQEYYL